MANGRWEHFGKFKSLSTVPTSMNGMAIKPEQIVATGNTYTIQGGPGLNPDGSPADGEIKLAHSLARQWGDKIVYHVGANYADQEGDTIVVSLGNSSTKRKGWANNVHDGISFATTTGGSFATTGGFSVNTIGGGRVQTFIGLECNFSEAATIKVAGGGVIEVFKTSKVDSCLQETSIVGTATKIYTSLKETLGSSRRVSLSQQSVASDVLDQSANHRVSTLGNLVYEAAVIDTKAVTKNEQQGNLTVTTTGNSTTVTMGVAKIDAILAAFIG